MNKIIIFILDSFNLYTIYDKNKYVKCYSYFDTEEAINNNLSNIITYDIGHLSFDLKDLGYDIFIGYNRKIKKFYPGMSTANGKELRKQHNLRRILIGGGLDNDLNINRNKFYYDHSKSTSELMVDQLFDQTFNIVKKIADKTIGIDCAKVKAMTNEESFEWHKKHSRIDSKTGDLIISDDEIGDGSFEQKYEYK